MLVYSDNYVVCSEYKTCLFFSLNELNEKLRETDRERERERVMEDRERERERERSN